MGCASSAPSPPTPAFAPLKDPPLPTPQAVPKTPGVAGGSFVDPPIHVKRGATPSAGPKDVAEGNPTLYLLLGGTGQLATSLILNALFKLFQAELLGDSALIIGVGRAELPQDDYVKLVSENLVPGNKQQFLKCVRYAASDACDAVKLGKALAVHAPPLSSQRVVVVFALPPRTIGDAAEAVSKLGFAWTRAVLHGVPGNGGDAPFVDEKVARVFGESRVFRVDPYAGMDTVNRVVAFRFANRVFEPTWNRNHVRAVLLDYAGDVSPEGEFYGVLRDVIADHLLSLVALVAMERPASRQDEDIRDAKAQVLASIRPARSDRSLLGRYDGFSKSVPTFATVVLEIDTNRWRGVPFIIRAGLGLGRSQTDVRILFRRAASSQGLWTSEAVVDNQVCLRIQPSSYAELGLVLANPASVHGAVVAVAQRFGGAAPYSGSLSAYQRLLLDVSRGQLANFARSDALVEAFRILQPLIFLAPQTTYPHGSRFGPAASDALVSKEVGGAAQAPADWVRAPGVGDDDVGAADDQAWLDTKDASVMAGLRLELHVGLVRMRLLVRQILQAMRDGLQGRASSMKMIPSFVTRLPTGDESGTFYALDMGGTNFRVSRFVLSPNNPVLRTDEVHFAIPPALMREGASAAALFDFLAESVASVQRDKRKGETAAYGFTFSFPVRQTGLRAGSLIQWTKGFATPGVVGADVVGLLRAALQAKGLKGTVAALVNDTVGTLAAGARDDHSTRAGVILGTGTNAAYVEKVRNLADARGMALDDVVVINTEWGDFGSGAPGVLPLTDVDVDIDRASPNPGKQWFEKLIAGFYLGEIARRMLEKLAAAGELWVGAARNPAVSAPHSFDSRHASNVECDESDDLRQVAEIEHSVLGLTGSSLADHRTVQTVCRLVTERAARLTACGIAALVIQLGLTEPCTVAFDGSLYEAHSSFRTRLEAALESLGCRCRLRLSKDGSGLGAALVAAAATSD